ncbi:recombinase RecT [Duganella sp. FT94W]|uniref:Recombinase RecT n=2 Tax=Duganella lactea TaxID=2692173 RepID=A0ABW9V849_9BURK|nr:recombinase RecT [Duganella lactea]
MQLAPSSTPMTTGQMILDVAHMDSMIRLADIMATGKVTLPQAYRNSPGDCLAVVMQSIAWQMNPFAVAQKTHFINGNIGYESQLVHAAITNSGIITRDDFDYEYYGPWENVIGKFDIKKNGDGKEYRQAGWHLSDEIGCGVRVSATIRATGKVKVLDLLLAQARTRNSTLWADDPKQQLGYLAVKKWARQYAPGIILGVCTPDELEQDYREPRDITPPPAGAAQGAQDLLPECTDELFKEKAAEWRQIILGGKKTPAQLIAMLSTRATFTEEQKLTIDSWAHETE